MGDEYYLQPPLNQKFYRYIANMMCIATVGNRKMWGYATYPKTFMFINIVAIIFAPTIIVSEIAYLCVNFTKLDIEILTTSFSVIPTTILANVDIYFSKTKTYFNLSRNLLSKIHLYNIYKYNKTEFVKKKLIFAEKSIRISSYYFICFCLTNWLSWVTMPTLNNYNNKEAILNHTVQLQTCVFLWLPCDYRYDFNNWIIVHAINSYIVFAGASAIMMYQVIFYMFAYNLIGHIAILKKKIKTEFKEDLTDHQVHFKLVEIIKYHNFTWHVFEDLQTAFGVNVAANYLQSLVSNSILLFQLMYGGKENLLQYITMVMAYAGGPIILSVVIEELRRRTYDLSDLLYAIPWENMSIPNQKIVLLMLQKMQFFMDFKAFGGISAGVAPMISILKTTFSYYVMLKSTRE